MFRSEQNRAALAAATCLALAGLISEAAVAQSHAVGEATRDAGMATLQEVVVTATRRTTSIQDVPFSINAYGGEALAQANISNLTELTNIVPGLIRPGGGGGISMRGAYSRSTFPGVDQDVGLFVDDVYVAGVADMDQEYFDIERIEVLRGPQGTLFGRNVTGGAVAIHTRAPSFSPEYSTRVGFGRFNDYKAQVFATGPLSEDLAYKLAISATGRDGYLKNFTAGGDAGAVENQSVRMQALYRPSENLRILLGAETFEQDQDAITQLFGTRQPGSIWPTVSYDDDHTSQYLGPEHPNGFVRKQSRSLLGRVEWDMGWGALTSITGYRMLEERSLTAGVGDPLNSDPVHSPSSYRQFTQELRIASPTNQALRWVAGVYYLDGSRRLAVQPQPDYRMFGPPYDTTTLPAIAHILAPLGYYHPGAFYKQDNDSESQAVFGEVDYDLSSQWTATVGARYTRERKSGFADRSNTIAYLAGPPMSAHYSADWSAVTPKTTLTYKSREDLLFYVTAARGFKSGAFDASTPSTVAGLQTPSDPSYVWNYEGGMKGEFFDRRLRANVSLFRMKFKDLQVAVFDPLAVSFAFKNAGRARNDGLELDFSARTFDWLTLGVAYTYQDGKYVDYVIPAEPPAQPTNNSGNELIQTPKNALSLYADAQWPVANLGVFSIGGSVLFRDKVFMSDTNADPAYVRDRTRVRGLVDLHAAWTSPGETWEIALWGRNVTNERYLLYSVDVSSLYRPATDPAPNSIRLATWNMPRLYGATVTWRWR